jgi:CubicO group peptidase (beta-lactamase class C family)
MRIDLIRSNRFLMLLALWLLAVPFTAGQAPIAKGVVAKVDEYMNAAAKFDKFSGTILIARNGVPVVTRSYGMANYELKVPNTPKTVFQIGSVSKQFTAMAIMQLQERGKLNLSDSICKHLDNCPAAWQSITIRHLLTHTSGITGFSTLPDWDDRISVLPYTRTGFVKEFRDLPLEFVPGEKYSYSNSGYYLLGLIIERASGKSYGEFLSENIFVPLGMKSSKYNEHPALVPNRATGYYWELDSFISAPNENLALSFASSGIYLTIEDLLLWDQALYTEKLVSRKSLNEIFTPFTKGAPEGDQYSYGYGWNIGKKFDRQSTSHSGRHNGFKAYIARFPSERVTVLVQGNSDRANATRIATNLAAIVFGAPYTVPVEQGSDMLLAAIKEKGIDAAMRQYRELKRTQPEKYNFNEPARTLNVLGYALLRQRKVKDAIEVFKLNVELFPQSGNPYDSLAEAYMVNGDKETAIKNYEKSLELDPKNTNAVEMLKQLRDKNR